MVVKGLGFCLHQVLRPPRSLFVVHSPEVDVEDYDPYEQARHLSNTETVPRIFLLGDYTHPWVGPNSLIAQKRSSRKKHCRPCKLAGIHGYTIHDHRHTAAVHLARAGMPLNLLMRQLGYSTIKMTMCYAAFHPAYSDIGKYFERVGETLGLGLAGNKSGNTSEKEVLETGALNLP